jgi:site-specific DNA-methyltransferase (adenine-specific)
VIEPVVIGNATLYLGDCREVIPTLRTVDSLITDPPYGLGLGKHRGSTDIREHHLTKGGYDGYEDTPENFLTIVVPGISAALNKSSRGMVFASAPMAWALPAPTTVGGVHLPSSVGRTPWGFTSWAMCLMYGQAPDLNKGCRPTGMRSTEKAPKDIQHPTVKPLSWMEWAVSLGSRAGETVLDPFMGSGTTGVACLNLGRQFIGIEREPRYFDIACKRIYDAQRQGRLTA